MNFQSAISCGMRLEVVIPTYNRAELLPGCLESLQSAAVPDGLTVGITVVDNNSKDKTKDIVESWKEHFGGRLNYLFEEKQGRSSALNRGITGSESDLVGFIDDDEEIDEAWYRTVYEAFTTRAVDFIGGPHSEMGAGAACLATSRPSRRDRRG